MRGTCAQLFSPAEFTTLNLHDITPNENGEILWHLVNPTPDQPIHKTVLAFREAYDIWQTALDAVPPAGRSIVFRSTDEFHKAQTKLFFLEPKTRHHKIKISDGTTIDFVHRWPFDGMGNVLAHVPPDQNDIYFDEGENWTSITKWQQNVLYVSLLEVALHEIGHTLDLGHTRVREAIMFPTAGARITTPHSDDVAGLVSVWGDKKIEFAAKQSRLVLDYTNDLLKCALRYYGLHETRGEHNDHEIIRMIRRYFPDVRDDSTIGWCSIFVDHVAKMTGYESSNSAMARSWLKVGTPVDQSNRQTGDIVVLWRNSPTDTAGHVGIYINDRDSDGKMIRVLGGNQNNSVNISGYPTARILGFRRLRKV